MSGDDKKPVHLGAKWKLVGGQVSHPETATPQPVRVFEVLDPETVADNTALETSPLARAAREALVNVARAKVERLTDVGLGSAWPIAKENAADRAFAKQRAKDRFAGKDVPPDLAITLMQRALSILEEIVVERSAGQIFADASAAPLGTYEPGVLRARLLAAIREEEAGYRLDMKPGERRDHALRRLAAAWFDCTGKKAKASYNRKDGTEMATPFGRFAEAVFGDAGVEVTPRQIRRALHTSNPKTPD